MSRHVPSDELDISGTSGDHLSMEQNSRPLTEDDVRVRAWAEVREPLELQLAPLGQRALKALAARPGENVLDIGCGGGTTALDLARAVAPDGTVLAIDLSAAVLTFAMQAAKQCQQVQFVHGDAAVFPFEAASFDAAFSRFGVMFFADPAAAFINIRRSLTPSGRLAFVCWRTLEENLLEGRVSTFAAATRSRSGCAWAVRFRRPRPRVSYSKRSRFRANRDHSP